MKTIKPSYFNFIVPVNSEEYLFYNSKTTGLFQLSGKEGRFVEGLCGLKKFDLEEIDFYRDMITDFYDKGYFIDFEVDEREQLHKIYSLNKDVYSKDAADINLTIGTTIMCNMGCSYCFEFVKPNKTMKDQKVLDDILFYLRDMVSKSPVRKWRKFNVVWYGGEPLINRAAIEKLSPRLIEFCNEFGMVYQAEIITNGLLLDPDTWMLLLKSNVQNVQVTIDGPKEIHEISRPLLGGHKLGNYDRIMENLSCMPEEMSLTIRVNLDKRIYDKFETLLLDLKRYGIWPQRYKNVHLDIAWLRTYDEN